jgi:putative phosphoesterase
MSTTLQSTNERLVGVISDTHGLLRSEALEAFQGVDLVIHAGDIGAPSVLEELRSVAPVSAVRGNMDSTSWAFVLPQAEIVEIGEVLVYVLHDEYDLDLDPAAAGFSAVISGHTHRPSIENRKGVLFLNPGTAGPFSSSPTVALLQVRGKSLKARLVRLLR